MKIKSFIIILLLVFFSLLNAQHIDWNITGVGARAASLGGAFIGVADDPSAIYWNPAGLAQLHKIEVSAEGKVVNRQIATTYYNGGNKVVTTSTHGELSFLSVVMPLSTNNIVAALAYQQVIDGNLKQETLESKGGVETFSFSMAKPYGNSLAIGTAINIWDGRIKTVDTGGVTIYNANERLSGFNFLIGALANISSAPFVNPLNVGVTVRTHFDLHDHKQSSIETRDIKLELPWMIGLGLSYRFNDLYSMSMDYESRLYAQTALDNPIYEGDSELSQHNLNQFRLGGEYMIQKTDYNIPLRFGVQTLPTIHNNLDGSGQVTGQVVGAGLSVGTGYKTDLFAIDMAFTWQTYLQKKQLLYSTSNAAFTAFVTGTVYFQ
jgi:long-subunit fatty acid transport protein